jgi:sulfur carrier protein ThiS
MIEVPSYDSEARSFSEFRRKVRAAEILSAAIERLLRTLHFTGRLSVVVQNGEVLKSGYEEGYFRQHDPDPSAKLQ